MDQNAVALQALATVIDPDLRRDIVTLGFIKDLVVDGANASLTLELTTPACPVQDELKAQSETALREAGFETIDITMTARVRPKNDVKKDQILPKVKHVIAIASGKGGVGKSTATVNLAVALAQTGARVGILDADVYGPSIPLMMGAMGERPFVVKDEAGESKMVPIPRYGVVMMSLGFLLEDDTAVLWRGPMVAGTVKQLLTDVDWGDLDYLLVDLPPGTGDAPMSLAQLAPLTGVVIVTTPHNVASNIAGKSVNLFRRLNAPIMGVIENMAAMIDPETGREIRVFAGLGGAELAQQLGVPYLGSIPLDPKVSGAGDEGVPALVAHPDSVQAERFHSVAGELARQASIQAMTRQDLTRLGDASDRPRPPSSPQ